MRSDGGGLTRQERDRLTGQPENAVEMDVKASALAFASLLLLCVFIVAASLIARLGRGPASGGAAPSPATHEQVAEPQAEPQEVSLPETDDLEKPTAPSPELDGRILPTESTPGDRS